MFCINCGTQLQEDAKFCQKCGRPQQAAPDVQKTKPESGRWEIKEFNEDISGHPTFMPNPQPGDGILDERAMVRGMRSHIDAAVERLLSRLTNEGWEPTEPTDAGRLALANRVITQHVKRGLLNNWDAWILLNVRIGARRWLTENQLATMDEICEFRFLIAPSQHFF